MLILLQDAPDLSWIVSASTLKSAINPKIMYQRRSFRNQDLGIACAPFCWGILVSRPSQQTEPENMCTLTYEYTDIYHCFYSYLSTYLPIYVINHEFISMSQALIQCHNIHSVLHFLFIWIFFFHNEKPDFYHPLSIYLMFTPSIHVRQF